MADAAIFDLDGVLVDSYRAHLASWRRLGEETGVEVTEEAFRRTFGRRSAEIIRGLWGAGRSDSEVARMDERKEALFRAMVENDFPEMPGARDLLGRLGAAGVALAIGSSAPPANVDLALRKLDVAGSVQAVVTGRDVRRGKPDPQVFLLAAGRLGIAPERCVVIEDAPDGIRAAQAGGMASIAVVSTGRSRPQLEAEHPDRIVDGLDEISVDMIRSLERG